jgi:hypothetical protein
MVRTDAVLYGMCLFPADHDRFAAPASHLDFGALNFQRPTEIPTRNAALSCLALAQALRELTLPHAQDYISPLLFYVSCLSLTLLRWRL